MPDDAGHRRTSFADLRETDDAPVVDYEPVTTAPPLEAVPANANADTDEVPRYMLRFAGD
jgi:hypothetical protein